MFVFNDLAKNYAQAIVNNGVMRIQLSAWGLAATDRALRSELGWKLFPSARLKLMPPSASNYQRSMWFAPECERRQRHHSSGPQTRL